MGRIKFSPFDLRLKFEKLLREMKCFYYIRSGDEVCFFYSGETSLLSDVDRLCDALCRFSFTCSESLDLRGGVLHYTRIGSHACWHRRWKTWRTIQLKCFFLQANSNKTNQWLFWMRARKSEKMNTHHQKLQNIIPLQGLPEVLISIW